MGSCDIKLNIKPMEISFNAEKHSKVNLMKCGFEMFRLNQHWVFHDFSNSTDPMIPYAKFLGIPQSVITKNGGAWFIDFTKPTERPNFLTSSLNRDLRGSIILSFM